MRRLSNWIDITNRRIGQAACWLVLLFLLVQFYVVVFRYIFGLNSILLQESITIMHGLVFMLAAAWVLQLDKHVRVDIFYHDAAARYKNSVNLFGSLFFLAPIALVILFYAWPYVVESWRVLEGSPEGGGIPVRYLQKTAILLFALTMAMQGLSIVLRIILPPGSNKS